MIGFLGNEKMFSYTDKEINAGILDGKSFAVIWIENY